MVANVDAMVRAGIEAYRAGKKAEARKLLEKAIELDDYNEQAWMWLSAVVDTEEEKRTCLENVIVINPDNEEAARGLKMLGVDGGGTAPTATASSANPFTDSDGDDFGDVDFAAEADSNDDWSTPPTATSSSSSVYQGPETSASEYDAWVDNLNLGGDNSQSAPPAKSTGDSYDSYESNDLGDMFGLDDGDDIFGMDDPFGSDVRFGNDDSDSFMSGPFGSDDLEDDFDLDGSPEPVAKKTSPAASKPVMSPGAESIREDSFLSELDSADFSGGDFIMGDSDFEDSGQPDFTPDELFSFIPAEIRATRLPGTKQSVSFISIIILVVLVALNIGAIAFVASSLI